VDLEVLDGKVTLKEAKLIPVNLKDSQVKIESDAYVESVLRPFKEKGDASLAIDLGTSDGEFVGARDVVRSQETNLGNLVTLAYKTKVKADLAITNSGGLRYSILPGKVTYESVLMVLPFAGELAIAELSGEELKNYLEFAVFNLTPGKLMARMFARPRNTSWPCRNLSPVAETSTLSSLTARQVLWMQTS
jgi:5'-nucleotidase/UDP-sugar diphosphatase